MRIGCAKVDITPDALPIGMLGYGVPNHTVSDIHTRLYARAYFMEPEHDGSQGNVAIAIAEIAFITPILKQRVVEMLQATYPQSGISAENLLLLAQHTHSAPGGYSYHPFYNISTPGLHHGILHIYAEGIANAIGQAFETRSRGTVKIGTGQMEEDRKVSFNRSMKAYNANKDTEPLAEEESHLAVDRTMTLLLFQDEDGNRLGSVNWYAVHTTSMPNTNLKVHSDNKGYASLYLEEHHRDQPGYTGAFAQGNSGDVTPNYIYDRTRKFNRFWNGPYPDHDRNALFNGRHQFEKALEIENAIHEASALSDHVDFALQWKDMSNIEVDSRFAGGREDACTSPSCLGLAMFIGTYSDGLGLPDVIIPLARSLSAGVKAYEENVMKVFKNERSRAQARKYKAQGVKEILMETGENRLFGTSDIKNFFMPGAVDKTMEWIKYFARKGAYDVVAMTPQVLPFQVIRIGELAIVAIPFEITTVAGKRLQDVLESELLGDGIEHVLVCPYANAYNGYITTFEEYQVQQYEGGHTVFGQWSLAAVMQVCDGLCREFQKSNDERSITSDVLPYPEETELHRLVF
jgi:neutral ceramidase